MDPILAMLETAWWAVPAAAGAGVAGWAGLRTRRTSRTRRLELDAARWELRTARVDAARCRADVQAARAEVARMEAERLSARASAADVAAARTALQASQSHRRAAAAQVSAHRADIRAARAALPAARAGSALPLPRLVSAHDAVMVRWMAYETDPAQAVAHPEMTDPRAPLTGAFLREQAYAGRLRPTSPETTMTPAEFAAYRQAVRRLARAFDAAEQNALRRATGRASTGGASPAPGAWNDLAQELAQNAQRAVARSADALGSAAAMAATRAAAGWDRRRRPGA
ncbi:hypothetical protein [Tersicoccus sp. Bi-70]|uniref:hypothetical protein n=1 Tax=Tersicoccus sp. Bi-70 TaxID=1897634 RepID=UPI0009FB7C25|nr:hypothetical protein [Tersicoccus sp. Bi-70]